MKLVLDEEEYNALKAALEGHISEERKQELQEAGRRMQEASRKYRIEVKE